MPLRLYNEKGELVGVDPSVITLLTAAGVDMGNDMAVQKAQLDALERIQQQLGIITGINLEQGDEEE